MQTIEKTIDVDAPVSTVYNQWTQFEDFPKFMEGVDEVRQLDDRRLHWKADVGGKTKEWDAEIFEQIPDQRVAWRSMTGAANSGMVNFEPLGANRTRIAVRMNYAPEGLLENAGDFLGVVGRRVQGDLERFKQFIQLRGRETGAWRGEIHGKQTQPPGSTGSVGGNTGGTPGGASGASGISGNV
jgi:uncharacterized membrane protein